MVVCVCVVMCTPFGWLITRSTRLRCWLRFTIRPKHNDDNNDEKRHIDYINSFHLSASFQLSTPLTQPSTVSMVDAFYVARNEYGVGAEGSESI